MAKGDRVDQMLIQALAASSVRVIKDAFTEEGMEKELGCTVIVFDYSAGGSLGYASTADRADMLRLLDEMRAKLAATLPADQIPRTDS